MTGLKVKRIIWSIAFLGVTLAAIVMEIVAGVWHPAGTIPWTEYIATYVPWPFQLVAYVALAVWLPFHFWRHDHLRRVEYDRGVRMGRRLALSLKRDPVALGLVSTHDLLLEIKARGEAEIYYRDLGNDMSMGAANLIDRMPGSMLEYRPVDGG